MESFIWAMRECGTPNVPATKALQKKQKVLTGESGLTLRHHSSAMGNQCYMNHPVDLIALASVNFIQQGKQGLTLFMPFRVGLIRSCGSTSMYIPKLRIKYRKHGRQQNICKRWIPNCLSPVWADWKNSPDKHFYIQELAQLAGDAFILPKRWIIYEGSEHVEAHQVVLLEVGIIHDVEVGLS